jgi:AraC-like DNA-binding protein
VRHTNRYLILRRTHLAWRALRDGTDGETRAAEVAMRFGFSQFGRFAGEYKSLFGEAPSATLRGPNSSAERGRFIGVGRKPISRQYLTLTYRTTKPTRSKKLLTPHQGLGH